MRRFSAERFWKDNSLGVADGGDFRDFSVLHSGAAWLNDAWLADAIFGLGVALPLAALIACTAGSESSGIIASTPFEPLGSHLTGPTGLIVSKEDPVALAKALAGFMRANQAFLIKGGFVDGQVLPPEGVRALADLLPQTKRIVVVEATERRRLRHHAGPDPAHHGGRHVFAQRRMGDRKCHRLLHCRVRHQNGLDLTR